MNIAVAILLDPKDQVLITQRAPSKPLGGYWEFPGGKVEPGESIEQALYREINEEIGVKIQSYRFLGQFPGKHPILLHVYLITSWSGEAHCKEDQTGLFWVHRLQLKNYPLLETNVPILNMLELS